MPIVSIITLSLTAVATIAWAHHPMAQPGRNAEPPWALFWLIGVGVFVAVFIAAWVLLSYIERQQQVHSGGQPSSQR
jgi:hypothetical protein